LARDARLIAARTTSSAKSGRHPSERRHVRGLKHDVAMRNLRHPFSPARFVDFHPRTADRLPVRREPRQQVRLQKVPVIVNGGLNPRLSGDYRSALVLGALRLAPAVGGQGVRPDLRRPEPGATFGGIFGWGLGAVARLTTARARGKSLPLLRGKHGADLNLAVWLDAVPHTVLGTNAGRVFRQSDRSSTPDLRGRRGRMR